LQVADELLTDGTLVNGSGSLTDLDVFIGVSYPGCASSSL